MQQHAFKAAASRGPVRVRLSVYARESRIGSKPIPVPKGVTVTIDGQLVKVKVGGCVGLQACALSNWPPHAQGPLGQIEQAFTPYVKIEQVLLRVDCAPRLRENSAFLAERRRREHLQSRGHADSDGAARHDQVCGGFDLLPIQQSHASLLPTGL